MKTKITVGKLDLTSVVSTRSVAAKQLEDLDMLYDLKEMVGCTIIFPKNKDQKITVLFVNEDKFDIEVVVKPKKPL